MLCGEQSEWSSFFLFGRPDILHPPPRPPVRSHMHLLASAGINEPLLGGVSSWLTARFAISN